MWREREADDFVAAIACFHESDRKLSDNDDNGTGNGSPKGSANGSANGHRITNESSDNGSSDNEISDGT